MGGLHWGIVFKIARLVEPAAIAMEGWSEIAILGVESPFDHDRKIVRKSILSISLLGQSPGQVEGLEFVETGQDTGSGHTTEDVGSGSLHQGHEALVFHDLHEAVGGALVLDSGAGGHHHAPPHGICLKGQREGIKQEGVWRGANTGRGGEETSEQDFKGLL